MWFTAHISLPIPSLTYNHSQVFRKQSEKIASEKHTTLSDSLATYIRLLKTISTFRSKNNLSSELKHGLDACEKKLRKYLVLSSNQSVYYYMAARTFDSIIYQRAMLISINLSVLDPRYKMSLFENNPNEFPDAWLTSMRLESLSWMKQDSAPISTPSTTHPTLSTAANTETNDSDDELWRDTSLVGAVPASAAVSEPSIEDELHDYLKEPRYAPNGKADPLVWWSTKENIYPRLARCAKVILAIPGMCVYYSIIIILKQRSNLPGSSVSVERIFSGGRDLLGIRRDSLTAETMRMLMLYYAQLWMEQNQK